MTLRTLELPDRAHRDALASVVGVARRLEIPLEDLYIGAGTALAMRWRHRNPTGLWVFTPPGSSHLERCGQEEILEAIEKEGGSDPAPGYKWAQWRHQGTLTGIHASSPLTEHRSEQREATTGLSLESSMSAFRKKLVGRIEATGDLVPRDAVDMVELRRREPGALRWLLRTYSHLRTPCIEECLLQAEVEPVERLKPLWACIADLFRGSPKEPLFEDSLPTSLLAPECRTGMPSFAERDVALLPDEAFRDPLFARRASFDEDLLLRASPSMAGHPMAPTPQEIRDWLRAEREEELPPNAHGFMSEFLKQLFGTRLFAFRQSCGASLRDIARMARWNPFMMSRRLKSGVNRLPKLRTSGSRIEETELYKPLTGFWTPA